MPKQTPHQLRQRIVDLAHDIGALRYLGDRLTNGVQAPVVFQRTIESTASMLEAELILIGEELGILAAPPSRPAKEPAAK